MIKLSSRKNPENDTIQIRESVERYARLILENTNDLLVIFDRNLKWEFINERAHKEVLGYSKEDLIGKEGFKNVHPEDVEPLLQAVLRIREMGDGVIEARGRHKNGSYIWLELKGRSFTDENGEEKYFLIARDISERKEAGSNLRESEEKYRSLVNTMNDGLAVQDEEGIITFLNPQLCKMFNYTQDEVIGKSWIDFVNQEVIKRVQPELKKREQGTGSKYEIPVQTKDGKQIYASLSAAPILDAQKKYCGSIAVVTDITDRKEAELKLRESEELYSTLVESEKDAVLIVQEGVYKFVNTATADITGYSKEELLGMPFLDLVVSEDSAFVAEEHELRMDGRYEDPKIYQIRIKSKDGSMRDISVNINTIQFEGKPAVLGTARDITKQKQAELMLKESEEKYRLITENVNDLILVLNKKFEIEYINEEAFLKTTGYSKEDLLGKYNFDFIDPDMIDEKLAETIKGFEDGGGAGEARIRMKDGTYKWFDMKGKMFSDKLDQTKMLIIARDISKRKKAEEARSKLFEEIQTQYKELKQLDRLKDDFFADVAHEVRNPLTAIVNFTELLLDSDTLGESELKALKIMQRSEIRLKILIEDLINFVKLKADIIQLKKDKFRVSKILASLIEDFKFKLKRKGIKIVHECKPDDELLLDQVQITRLIRNLIDNAIKFSTSDSEIKILSKIEKGNWWFSMTDSGIGLKKEDIDLIFTRFGRTEDASKLDHKGMGLGLAICRSILEKYQGKIWAESAGLGKGTTFFFEIPLEH